ncbi:RUS family member 1-like [Watersipora subatra]|uniref:RUS family member 1-like n=1 Tax=Watersipora subatra TaxID=2589382 RepID=UPI00355B4BEC
MFHTLFPFHILYRAKTYCYEMAVLFDEQYGSTTLNQRYVCTATGAVKIIENKKETFQSIGHAFRSVFLPQGYPESVSEDYLLYQIYDTIQAFASSITGTLATQAMLKGVGVGDESATALAATMTWILKDGTGMLGRILFAWLQGSSLDCDAKRWRLFADMLNDFAICLEISAPFFPLSFTFIVCTAGVCKSIVGVAGGSTRAALTLHQARRNNMADVSAKDGSQETLVNLAALICSLLMVPIVAEQHLLVWALFTIFTGVHLWANYSAVTSVVMETVNQARLHILVQDFFRRDTVSLLSVKETNMREPVIFKTNWRFNIFMGSQLRLLSDRLDDLAQLQHLYSVEKYILGLNTVSRKIHIVLRRDSTEIDQLMAAFQAEVINVLTQMQQNGVVGVGSIDHRLGFTAVNENAINEILCSSFHTAMAKNDAYEVSRTSLELTKNLFPIFFSKLQNSGWTTSHVLLGADEWRASWGSAMQ